MSDEYDFTRHYARMRGVPTFGYHEREQFGDIFFDWLTSKRIVHARETQLSFSLGIIERGIIVISPKGGFTNVPRDYTDSRLIETR